VSDIVSGPVDGQRVPEGSLMLRYAQEPPQASLNAESIALLQEGRCIPQFYDNRKCDKTPKGYELSVFHSGRTTQEQVVTIATGGAVAERNQWMMVISADSIRAIESGYQHPDVSTDRLEVVWREATRPAPDGERVPDSRPGADGHSVILKTEGSSKQQARDIRQKLAEASTAQRHV